MDKKQKNSSKEDFNKYIKQVEEALTVEKILALLEKYGVKPQSLKNKKDNELWFQTVCHHGDSHKLCLFKDSKRFYCYTNCGPLNFFQVFMQVKNCSFYQALQEIAQIVGIKRGKDGIIVEEEEEEEEPLGIDRKQQTKSLSKGLNPSAIGNRHYEKDKNILDYFDKNVFYQGWIDDGISITAMQKFNIEWYELESYIIIPHRDKHGDLIGIRRRSLKPEDANNKYMPLIMKDGTSYEHSLGMNLYGLYENKQAIERNRRIILVEGEKSVLLAESFYENGCGNTTVATCGFNVSDYQIALISELDVAEIIIAFDADYPIGKLDGDNRDRVDKETEEYKEFFKYKKKIANLAYKLLAKSTADVSIIWDRKGWLELKESPLDEGQEIFENLLRQRIPIKRKKIDTSNIFTTATIYEKEKKAEKERQYKKFQDQMDLNLALKVQEKLNKKITKPPRVEWEKVYSYNYTYYNK